MRRSYDLLAHAVAGPFNLSFLDLRSQQRNCRIAKGFGPPAGTGAEHAALPGREVLRDSGAVGPAPELQRDLALLQEQVRSMQRSQDEKFSAIQVLVQQALDSANKTSTSVALLQNNLQQSFKDQQKSVVDPVVGVGAKIDQMTTDVSAMREAVADISSQMGKLQQQMVDIGNAVRSI